VVTQKVRRVGNSLVVTIPREEAERQNISEGDFVGLEVRKVRITPTMSPEVRAAFEQSWERYGDDYRFLAEH